MGKVTPEIKAKMQKLWDQEWTYEGIAAEFSIAYSTVYYHLNPQMKEIKRKYKKRWYKRLKGGDNMEGMENLLVERFEILEKNGPMTPTQLAMRMWISKDTARTWLSRMTNYKHPDGKTRQYLIYDPPKEKSHRRRGKRYRNEGTYRINPECEWTELHSNFV